MIANELRIGNWVSTIYGMEFQVYPMAFKQMPTDEKHNLILNTWKPIPLTEEWLLKLGFERDNQANWKLKSGYHWIEIYSYHVYINGQQVVLIEYVHQLQNIWFALTGKELTYGGKK